MEELQIIMWESPWIFAKRYFKNIFKSMQTIYVDYLVILYNICILLFSCHLNIAEQIRALLCEGHQFDVNLLEKIKRLTRSIVFKHLKPKQWEHKYLRLLT